MCAQRRLRSAWASIRPVWLESSLCTQWIAKSHAFFMWTAKNLSLRWAHMPFLLVLSWGGSYMYLKETVASPDTSPPTWTVWDQGSLTVDSYRVRGHLTHDTATDKFFCLAPRCSCTLITTWHGRQPVGCVALLTLVPTAGLQCQDFEAQYAGASSPCESMKK